MTNASSTDDLQAAFNRSERLLSVLPAGTVVHVQTVDPAAVVLITVTQPQHGLADVVVPENAQQLDPGAVNLVPVQCSQLVCARLASLPANGRRFTVFGQDDEAFFMGKVTGATIVDLIITSPEVASSAGLVGAAVDAARRAYGSGARHLTVAADPDATGGFHVLTPAPDSWAS